jgi:hypothetical protein
MPIFIFNTGVDEWLKEQFGKGFVELLNELGKEEIGKALLTVHLMRERSSLNDFTSYANELGKKLTEKKDVVGDSLSG